MSKASKILVQLSALGLSIEQMAGVLEIIEDREEDRRAEQRARKARSRLNHKENNKTCHGTIRDVTGQSVTIRDQSSPLPSPLVPPSDGFPHPSLTPPYNPPIHLPSTPIQPACAKPAGRKRVSLSDVSVDHIADWLAKKRSEGKYLNHDEHFILEQFKTYCQAHGRIYADPVAAYRNAFEWERCQPKQHQRNPGADARGVTGQTAGTYNQPAKPSWKSEGDRLAAKYLAQDTKTGSAAVHDA